MYNMDQSWGKRKGTKNTFLSWETSSHELSKEGGTHVTKTHGPEAVHPSFVETDIYNI